MGNFAYEGTAASTTLERMFRFPGVPSVHIQCAVRICPQVPCPKV